MTRRAGPLVRRFAGALALFAVLAPSCRDSAPRELQVHAAASLREACDDLALSWSAKHPETELVFNFAASSFLAEQILATRRADLFLSADRIQLERVRAGGLVAED